MIFTQSLKNALMIPIKILGLNSILFLIICCNSNNDEISYGESLKPNVIVNEHYFYDYCNDFANINIEKQEIISSFVGEYLTATNLVSKRSDKYLPEMSFSNDEVNIKSIKEFISKEIHKYKKNDINRLVLERTIEVIERPIDTRNLFNNHKIENAESYIIKQAKKFHFTSINESHHSGQNRSFTTDLLKPLWEEGYRYFAIEALSSKDTVLNNVNYPTYKMGTYFKETNLGNMVREALSIGYKLIQYDIVVNQDLELIQRENIRDKAQAENIYLRTLKIDTIGKVLIHSGHDHQMEFSLDDGHEAMGASLKKISNKDILTINQNVMVENNDKENDYYSIANGIFDIYTPSVFLNKDNNKCLVDPVKYLGGIDVQVYHPRTNYISGRPHWMIKKTKKLYNLSNNIKKLYKDHLLIVRPIEEKTNSTPIDQFIIDDVKRLILPRGKFLINIIDCNRVLKESIPININ